MPPFSKLPPLAPSDEADVAKVASTVLLEQAGSESVRKTHKTAIRQAATENRQNATETRQLATELRQSTTEVRQHAIEVSQEATEVRQIASEDYRILLQQANERLVVTAVEAQILAEQLRATQSQLEIAKLIAEQANLAKSNFLSSMSHELRTPLNAILGFAQLLEIGSPPPTDKQMLRLQQIIKAGWYLLELINEILDLAVIESGKVPLLLESVSLPELMHECQAMIDPLSRNNAIPIHFLPITSACIVHVDRTRLKQAIINLLSNAIKYNRPQGTVEVSCTESGPHHLRICVKDSGAGLSIEQQAQLFQPFNRLGQESSTKEGTGIGLVVTKQLIELMGGSIGVKSKVGVGSEFWIELVRDVPPARVDSHLPL